MNGCQNRSILRLTRVFQQVIHEFFPTEATRSSCAMARAMSLSKTTSFPATTITQATVASRLHINFPDVICTLLDARLIASGIAEQLENVFDHDPEMLALAWNEVVLISFDLSPYNIGCGLRMIHQGKMEVCGCVNARPVSRLRGAARSKSRPAQSAGFSRTAKLSLCPVCHTHGRLECGRVYTPHLVVKDDGQTCDDAELLKMQLDPYYAFLQTFIRVPMITPLRRDFRVPLAFSYGLPVRGILVHDTELIKTQVLVIEGEVPEEKERDDLKSIAHYAEMAETCAYDPNLMAKRTLPARCSKSPTRRAWMGSKNLSRRQRSSSGPISRGPRFCRTIHSWWTCGDIPSSRTRRPCT